MSSPTGETLKEWALDADSTDETWALIYAVLALNESVKELVAETRRNRPVGPYASRIGMPG